MASWTLVDNLRGRQGEPGQTGPGADLPTLDARYLQAPALNLDAYGPQRPLWIAHAADQYVHLRDTLEAVRLAYAEGADTVEVNTRVTADGAVVLNHELDLDLATNGTGPVAAQTLSAIRRLTVDTYAGVAPGYPATPPGTLQEVLREFGGQHLVTIDVKNALDADLAQLARYALPKSSVFLLTAADAGFLKVKSAGYPAMYDDVTNLAAAQALGVVWVGKEMALCTPDFVADATTRGMKVITYFTNRRADRDRFLAMGVSGFFSDDSAYTSGRFSGMTRGTFGSQVWLPGLQSNSPGTRDVKGRGKFFAPDWWGYDLDGTFTDLALHGYLRPPDPSNYTLTMDAQIDAVTVDTRGLSVGLTTTDGLYMGNTTVPGLNGVKAYLRQSGRMGTTPIVDGQDGAVHSTESPVTTAIPLGTPVGVQVIVSGATGVAGAGSITIKRLDTGAAETNTGLTIPPVPYIHLGRFGAGVRFRNLVVA